MNLFAELLKLPNHFETKFFSRKNDIFGKVNKKKDMIINETSLHAPTLQTYPGNGEPMSVVMDKPVELGALKEASPEEISSIPLPSTVQKGRILWIYVVPIVLIHLTALLAFVPYFFSWTSVVVMLVSIEIYGLGISLGYHRLLAHRSLKVPKWLEHGFAMFGF